MIRSTAVVVACLLLAGCGDGPLGAAEGAAPAPADAPAGVAAGPDYAGDFDLVGTEPFWAGKVREGALTLDRMEGGAVALPNPGVRIDGEQGVWDAEQPGEAGPPGGEQGHRLVFRLTPQPCSDGMSDRVFTHAAEVWLDGTTFKGCAARTDDLARQGRP